MVLRRLFCFLTLLLLAACTQRVFRLVGSPEPVADLSSTNLQTLFSSAQRQWMGQHVPGGRDGVSDQVRDQRVRKQLYSRKFW
ncbi:unnamed protein product, partial [Mesorhabditis spiculigera]